MKKRVVLSVSDKTGLVPFAQKLVDLGFELISTGGTYKTLQDHNIPALYISEVTNFPEILDGRVKTLHPAIHGGILARDTEADHKQAEENGIQFIDMVVVNLYPFQATIQKPECTLPMAIENIDIGGPTMIRSAAKNHARVAVVVDPTDYEAIAAEIAENGALSQKTRELLALKAFRHTAEYDYVIQNYLAGAFGADNELFMAMGKKDMDLRYGENPHQKATLYKAAGVGPALPVQLQGKELSYNNIQDMDAARTMAYGFDEPCCVIVKHTNPCGAALGENLTDAYVKAYNADPVSAFGGIVALNGEVDAATATEIAKLFAEVVIAPGYTDEAKEIFAKKKNLRVMVAPLEAESAPQDIKTVLGGLLVQEKDRLKVTAADLKCVTKVQPTEAQIEEMLFAFHLIREVKSNAIIVTKDRVLIGSGPGQTNRVGAAEIAFGYAGEKAEGAVLASDAFFPFGDTVEAAAKHGIKAIIQPGGSVRDQESIDMCDKYGIAMVFTGVRHFKH